ncbi:MAG: hypothetical protein ABIQ64_02360 [Candidatus Saccharimonadales bacterium]
MSETTTTAGTGADSAPDLAENVPTTRAKSVKGRREQTSKAQDRPVPTMGLPLFVYWISNGKWHMSLSAREVQENERLAAEAAAQAKADAEEARRENERLAAEAAAQAKADAEASRLVQEQADRDEYQEELEKEIVSVNQNTKWTSTTSNVKGGVGKTPITANSATVLASVTSRVVTVVDNNPNWGTTAMLLGIDPSATISVRTMAAQLKEGGVNNFTDFSAPLGSTRDGVQLIASDALARRDSYGYEVAKSVITAGKVNSIFVEVDTGNEISDSAMRATLELSDVLVVPCLPTHAKLEGAVHTMENYREWGHDRLVRHAVVVVTALPRGDYAENYRDRLRLDDKQVIIGIPFDDDIHNDRIIDRRRYPQETYISLLELVLAKSRVAKHVRLHPESDEPIPCVQGQMVRLKSGRTPVLSYVKRSGDKLGQEVSSS